VGGPSRTDWNIGSDEGGKGLCGCMGRSVPNPGKSNRFT